MNKVCFVILALLAPQCVASGEYVRVVSAETVIENRAGVTASVKRSSLSRRIERFAVKHGADPAIAPELAELLVACDNPRELAAIAAKESRYKLNARGAAGEVGAFQILPRVHGHPGKTWNSQTKAAERILRELVAGSGGKIEVAVRKYNGSGKKAERYASHVMAMARSI